MQTTVRLQSPDYGFFSDGSVGKLQFVGNSDDMEMVPTKYVVGRQAVLVGRTDVSPNAIRSGTKTEFYLSFDLDGVSGNSNPQIKRTSGWRGTTNDVSCDAYGVVTIRKIRELKNGSIAVTVS